MPNDIEDDSSLDCDHAGYTACTSCGCSECGALVDRETLTPFRLPSGATGYACAECHAGADSDGVPVEVADEVSGDKTVRATYEPIGRAGLGDVRSERKAASL